MKLDTLKDSEGPQVGATHPERRPGMLKKYTVIAKMPKFDWKCNGRMTTRHFKQGRTAAQAIPGVTAVFGEE
jgi:hypothetical protein